MTENAPRSRPVLPVLVAGLLVGGVLAIVLGGRDRRRTQALRAAPPVGRVGEQGPQWTVEESALVHRSPGEVAAHLHAHGGLPGLRGGLDGPPMDHIGWEADGGRYEAVVHGLPGAGRTELTVRWAPGAERPRASRGATAASAMDTPPRNQVRTGVAEQLDRLRRELEQVSLDNPHDSHRGSR